MPSPSSLSPALWQHFFLTLQRLGLQQPGARLVLRLLAAGPADGPTADTLHTDDLVRISQWKRRRQWVEAVFLGHRRDGPRLVRYQATPALRALFGVEPAAAARMLLTLERLARVLEQVPGNFSAIRLLSMLVSVAACADPQGYPARSTPDGAPFRSAALNYRPFWDLLGRLGLVDAPPRLPDEPPRLPDEPRRGCGRLRLTPRGRQLLGLPAAATPVLRTPQPYRNASAA